MSTKFALSKLLNGPCYHMTNLVDETGYSDAVGIWEKAVTGQQVTTEEWREFFKDAGFKAVVDFPAALFYK